MKKLNIKQKDKIKSYLNMTFGVLLAAFAFSFFLNPYSIVIGGVSGVGVIFKGLTDYDASYIMFGINGLLLLISLVTISKEFFLKTVFGAITFPAFVWIFDRIYVFLASQFPQILPTPVAENISSTTDPNLMLIILFSSIIMGYGLGIVVKHGGSTGGTEIPQKILNDKVHMPYSLSLYLIDGSVILLGLILLKQNVLFVLYEFIFMIICGFVMDTTIFSGFNKRCVNVISDKCDDIKAVLLKDFARGVTSIKVIGEFTKSEKKMLVCVLSTMEYYKLRDIIESIDPKAFFYCTRASEVRGEGFTYESRDSDNQ